MKNFINNNLFVNKIHKAFTLSEVLITLTIIGIIAGITISMIHAQYDELVRKAQVKKTYSKLSNTMYRVIADGGSMFFKIDADDYKNVKDWFDKYLKKYLGTIKVCYDTSGCWNDGDSYNMDGSIAYKNRTGVGIGNDIITAVLNDGTFINMNVQSASAFARNFGVDLDTQYGLEIYFDINGSKKPNTIGKDIFPVVFTRDGLVPAYKSRTEDEIKADCSSSGQGYSCIQKYLDFVQ